MRKKKRTQPKKRKKINYEYVMQHRFLVFLILSFALFGLLVVKMYQVMIGDKEVYQEELQNLTYATTSGESTPRCRILDRNYNVIVDNIAVHTITYAKQKGTTVKEMTDLAYLVSSKVSLDTNRLTLRSKKEFYEATHQTECRKLIKESQYEKYAQKKLTNKDIYELKIKRIDGKMLETMTEEDNKAAYLYYLMNTGYAYAEKTIKTNASDQEYAYISENNDKLKGFNTSLSWERTYPYGDTLKSILGTVSTSSQGLPAEEKEHYLSLGYSLNDRVGLSYLEK